MVHHFNYIEKRLIIAGKNLSWSLYIRTFFWKLKSSRKLFHAWMRHCKRGDCKPTYQHKQRHILAGRQTLAYYYSGSIRLPPVISHTFNSHCTFPLSPSHQYHQEVTLKSLISIFWWRGHNSERGLWWVIVYVSKRCGVHDQWYPTQTLFTLYVYECMDCSYILVCWCGHCEWQ